MKLPEGFYKVSQSMGCYVSAGFFNPTTKEFISMCVRDYDYADGSRDDELYYMPINEEVRKAYFHHKGIVLVGDTVRVFKGKKLPIGYIGTIASTYEFKDKYGRMQAEYVVFEDGKRTNIDNVELYEGELSE